MDYSFGSDYKSIDNAINDLLKNSNLNNWEKGFIFDIKTYVRDGGFLSETQLNILNEIWEKYIG